MERFSILSLRLLRDFNGVFGLPNPEPASMLLALVADSAVMRQYLANTDRQLEAIVVEVSKRVEAVMRVLLQTSTSSADMQEIKARCETIEKNLDDIAILKFRSTVWERDLIANGKLRMSVLEGSKKTIVLFVLVCSWCGLPALSQMGRDNRPANAQQVTNQRSDDITISLYRGNTIPGLRDIVRSRSAQLAVFPRQSL